MKTTNKILLLLMSLIAGPAFSEVIPQKKMDLPLQKLKLPENFEISIFAVTPGARSMSISPDGTVFVGTGGVSGSVKKVYAIRDNDGDFKADTVRVLADGLNNPNGVAFKGGDLYIGEIDQIKVIKDVEKYSKDLKAKPKIEKIGPTFPKDTHHGWKFIRFDSEGMLYVPVGAPCNVCDPGTEYARIYKVDLKKNTKEVIAQGVRNTVGFDFHPETKELWFTDNGRDWMGDDIPPCELNRIAKNNQNYGFPYCHGKNVKDTEHGSKKDCKDYVAPVWELPAHVAPLGMRFYTGKQFPDEYKNQIFVAEHGSWNRTKPQGYKVSLFNVDKTKANSYKPFVEGWFDGKDYWGRPVDVEIYTDGSLLISDDYAGVIYRVRKKTVSDQ